MGGSTPWAWGCVSRSASLRDSPQTEQRPAHSGRQRGCEGSARTRASLAQRPTSSSPSETYGLRSSSSVVPPWSTSRESISRSVAASSRQRTQGPVSRLESRSRSAYPELVRETRRRALVPAPAGRVVRPPGLDRIGGSLEIEGGSLSRGQRQTLEIDDSAFHI